LPVSQSQGCFGNKNKSPEILNNYTKNVPVKIDDEILNADSHRPSRLTQE